MASSAEFVVPASLEALDMEGKERLDVAAMAGAEAESLVDSVAVALSESEPTCVVETELFAELYSLTCDFTTLPPSARAQLVDSLCSNLSVLCSACGPLDAETEPGLLAAHRNSLKAYAFFLTHILLQSEAEAREAAPAAAPKAKAGKKGAANAPSSVWDWDFQRERILRPLSTSLDTDLLVLFRGRPVEETFLNLYASCLAAVAADTAALKNKAVRAALSDIVGSVAVRYGQSVTLSTALLHLLNKHEHLPTPIAEWTEASVKRFSDSRLAAQLLRDIGAVDPREYKRQAERDAPGVRSTGALLAELAERLPLTVGKNVALLRPHLEGEAQSMRSALVTCVGHLVLGYSDPEDVPAQPASQQHNPASALRVAAKQGFLDCLFERVHDCAAFTRARVLATLSLLAEKKALPLPHVLLAAEAAVGRLSDTKAVVRKAAAALLRSVVEVNPFAAELATEPLEATLTDWKGRLADSMAKAEQAREAEAARAAAAGEAAGQEEEGDDAAASVVAAGLEGVAVEEKSEAEALAEEEAAQAKQAQLDGGMEALRTMVAALTAALSFSRSLADSVPMLIALLSSATASDAVEAVHTLVTLRQFGVDGAAPGGVRAALRLVFSKEPSVRAAALEAAETLFLKQEPAGAAASLLELVNGASLGDLVAAEEVLTTLVRDERLAPTGPVVRHLWAEVAGGRAAAGAEAEQTRPQLARRAAALTLLGYAAGASGDVLPPQLHVVLDAARAGARGHGPLARAACAALARLPPGSLPADHAAFESIAALLGVGAQGGLSGPSWFPVAEQAFTVVYSQHPAPEHLAAGLLARMATDAGLLSTDSDGPPPLSSVCAQRLARFLFALGTVALKQLVWVEASAKGVRSARAERERKEAMAAEAARNAPPPAAAKAPKAGSKAAKAAAAAAETAPADEPGGLASQLGQGSVSLDAELDGLRETAEAEIIGGGEMGGVVALFAPFAVAVASQPDLLRSHPLLRASALSALCRLCAVDAAFCERQLPLLFTRMRDTPAAGARASLMVALGDLAFRFPNAIEPWTQHVYGTAEWGTSLHDPDAGVRKHALTVLSHLVLNDMMKVKGHIADMARCLEDPSPGISGLAKLFLFELSHRTGAPIYNLLPDLLSRLSADVSLDGPAFGRIMRHLLSFVDKDKQTDSLVDKLLARMPDAIAAAQAGVGAPAAPPPPDTAAAAPGEEGAAAAAAAPAAVPAAASMGAAGGVKACRDITFCLSVLQLSERGLTRLMEGFKLYEPALGDPVVLQHIEQALKNGKKGKAVAGEAKEGGKEGAAAAKGALEEFEAKLRGAAAERAEVHRATQRALRHQGTSSGGPLSPEEEAEEAAERAAAENAEENAPPPPAAAARKGRGKAAAAPKKTAAPKKAAASRKKAAVSDDEDEDDAGGDSEEEAAAPKAKPLTSRSRRAAA